MTPEAATEEVRLTEGTLLHFKHLVKDAVREGIAESMTDDNAERFWTAGVRVLQKNAAQHAGRVVLGGLKGIASRAFLFLLLGGVVYAVGGWSALAGLFKTLFYTGGG